ncbi:hypothetical protein J8F10_06395 [Gemmata sp. G18]|uniref:Uncharacterized protein n=1 Tax=Gemmata palustris TaxID=2822762 RepID=A0ABS5BMG3_9BACT|nr:hypothetical protein [Gemmata palustris]MBP3954909.1 hypothetical protein [Gemmata palustris]
MKFPKRFIRVLTGLERKESPAATLAMRRLSRTFIAAAELDGKSTAPASVVRELFEKVLKK